MAGHSKFKNIMHRKGRQDAKRAKIFAKLGKELSVAARAGTDSDFNPRLRLAIVAAKAQNMPNDNIKRAIQRAEMGDAANYEEVRYEGYGPGGVAIIVETLTDNRNRTAPEVRKLFETHGGKLGATGCVAYLFQRKGLILISADKVGEDQLMEIALENGADDVRQEGDKFEVTCDPDVFSDLTNGLEQAEIEVDVSQVTRIPSSTVDLDVEMGRKVLRLMELLDDHDDVQNVSANFNLADDALAQISTESS